VPIPILALLTIAIGAAAAYAARYELRSSPRSVVLTRGFQAYLIFAALVLGPLSTYFYYFHGDWSLLYSIDTESIPSAVALVVIALQVAAGAGVYFLAAAALRAHRDGRALALVATGLLGAAVMYLAGRSRMVVVGTYAQYHGDFGLQPYEETSVLMGGIVMGMLLTLSTATLLGRIYWAARSTTR